MTTSHTCLQTHLAEQYLVNLTDLKCLGLFTLLCTHSGIKPPTHEDQIVNIADCVLCLHEVS